MLFPAPGAEKYFFHFPDGNASIARMFVRKLIPEAIPGHSANDIVLAQCQLCQARRPFLTRSHSLEQHRCAREAPRRSGFRQGNRSRLCARRQTLHRTRAPLRARLLACRHSVYLRRTAAGAEKGLASAAKVPLLYTNVALRNWTSFQNAGSLFGLRARLLSLPFQSGSAREHRWLRLSPPPR